MADATFTDATTAGVAHVELMMSAEHRNQDDGHGTTTIQGSQQPVQLLALAVCSSPGGGIDHHPFLWRHRKLRLLLLHQESQPVFPL